MEKYDSQLAQRVWNRVLAEPETPRKEPGHLYMQEARILADYTKLLPRFPAMKPLLADTRRHMNCLRGIRYLKDGARPDPISIKPREETDDITLRRCYGQCVKAAAACRALADDPEYGICFASMAEDHCRHCRSLLELIGNSGIKHK